MSFAKLKQGGKLTQEQLAEVGEFKSVPLFLNGLNHHNNIALAKVAKRNIVSFKASDGLAENIT